MADRHDVELSRQLQRDERTDLIALLHELDPDDWTRPTPCPDWTVADVAAHILAWEHLLAGPTSTDRATRSARLLLLAIRSRFSIDRMNERLRQRTSINPSAILSGFDAPAVDRWKWRFDRLSPGAQLAEYIVHHEDIRTATGRPRRIPTDRLNIALAGVHRLPGVHARKRRPEPDLAGPALLLRLAGR